MSQKHQSPIVNHTAVRTYAEVARIADVSEAAVRQVEYRAIRKLRVALIAELRLPVEQCEMTVGEWLRWHCMVDVPLEGITEPPSAGGRTGALPD